MDHLPFRPRVARRLTLATKVATAIARDGHFIHLDYPPASGNKSRWGYGQPPHARLSQLLGQHDEEYREVLSRFEAYSDQFLDIPVEQVSSREPHWRNGFLFGLDGVSLYGFTRERAPQRYVEIGSGNSTLFVDRARRDGDMPTKIISIDPYPRREIDEICDGAIREPLENADLRIFSDLRAGDIVFFDGTHRVFMNSDVTVFFLDVLPELPPGILIGIHDIHLPYDYRPEHADRYCSEQYLLAAYLLGEPSWMRPVLPCWYVSHHLELGGRVSALTPWGDLPENPHGVIFWLQTEPRR